jgi:hypothetical protein
MQQSSGLGRQAVAGESVASKNMKALAGLAADPHSVIPLENACSAAAQLD